MIALLQRVTYAKVAVEGAIISSINHGLLIFLAVLHSDSTEKANRLAQRVAGYRVFSDQQGKTNLNVLQVAGEILVVPQFTLAANTQKGMRPGFSNAANPDEGEKLFHHFVHQLQILCPKTSQGIFGADMQVSLCNDGPMTFWLEI